jgi:hypothetical protein
MTSSRDSPFSFSPDLRLSLGAPDALNVSLRFAFPGLFSRDYGPTRAVAQVFDDRSGPRLEVRPGASIPAGSLVGLFSGHLFVGTGVRGTRTISIPPGAAVPGALHLAVDGAARSSRFPSAAEAALYGHSCTTATVVGSWWFDGPVPCLVAHASRTLLPGDCMTWDLDTCSSAGYTSSHAEARAWRRAGNRTVRCSCNAPRDCPRDRFICLAAEPSSSDDSE